MKKFQLFVFALALVFAASAVYAQGRVPAHPAKKRIPFNLLKDAIQKLDKAESKLTGKKKLNRKKAKTVAMEIKEARLQIKEFLIDVESRKQMLPAYECCPCKGKKGEGGKKGEEDGKEGAEGTEGAEEPKQEMGTAMPEPQFAALLQSLGEQGFADDKLSVLTTAAAENYFTVNEVRRLLVVFSFPDDKLAALKLVKGRITDPDNGFKIYSSFIHSSDKDKARKILEGK